MKEWMKRVLSIFGAVLVITLSVCSFSFESSAANNSTDVTKMVFLMPIAEPERDADSGYINVLMRNKENSNYVVRSYYWSCVGSTDNTACTVNFYIYTSSDTITFNFKGHSTFSLYDVRSATGAVNQLVSNSTETNFMVDVSSLYDCVSYQGYGNVETSYPTSGNYVNFTVLWGDEAVQYSQMLDVIDELNALNTATNGASTKLSTLITQVTNIYNSVDTVETKLENIYNLINTNFASVITELLDQGTTLHNIDNDTSLIYSMTKNIYNTVLNIYNLLLKSGSSESIPSPPSDDFDNYQSAASELPIGEDLPDDVTNVEIDLDDDASGLIWDILESFLDVHPILYTLIIFSLSMGLFSLVMGR